MMLPEEFDAMRDGMTAGHLAAREALKARRPDLPVGLSIAIVDDRVAGDDPTLRDRKRAEVYDHWLRLAREDDFIGIQNYESAVYDANGLVPPRGVALNLLGSAIDPRSLGGAARYAHEVSGVPVFVTEHGIAVDDDSLRAGFIEPSLAGLLDAIEDGVPVLGYCHWTLLDNFDWTVGYNTFHFGLHTVDRETFSRAQKPSAAGYAAIATSRTVKG
jgi:beta-glucosidase